MHPCHASLPLCISYELVPANRCAGCFPFALLRANG